MDWMSNFLFSNVGYHDAVNTGRLVLGWLTVGVGRLFSLVTRDLSKEGLNR